jgi:formylglycine-generating enzyme required for sulfatase activity
MRIFVLLISGICFLNPSFRPQIRMTSSASDVPRPPKNKAGIEFVYIPGGTFRMGDTFGEGDPAEKPVHVVTLSGFFLGKTEVTVAQYRAFCKATGKAMPRPPFQGWKDDNPMDNVSWNDTQAFCRWAECRLPTEAEWEYAAREGGKRLRFGDGRDVADSRRINYDGRIKKMDPGSRISVEGEFRRQVTAVAAFPPNALGLHDMSGNVAEFCSDWWSADYYKTGPRNDPRGPANGFGRVLRGGAYDYPPSQIRNAARGCAPVISWGDDWGFRAARSAGP